MSTKVKISLLERIVAFLGLDDAGKIKSFLDSEVKNCKIQIKKLESNIKQSDLRNEIALEELDRKIEDAKEAIEDAYMNVNVEKIKTNADKDSFAITYWSKIKIAENKLKALNADKEELLKSIKETTKDTNEQIAAYNVRIQKLDS